MFNSNLLDSKFSCLGCLLLKQLELCIHALEFCETVIRLLELNGSLRRALEHAIEDTALEAFIAVLFLRLKLLLVIDYLVVCPDVDVALIRLCEPKLLELSA